ncbi:hypothetical protein BD414DRAFT_440339 [Trametes punicea]|nr:hypothetical protein BD414DRAFT_440339 [Trametes punicea]
MDVAGGTQNRLLYAILGVITDALDTILTFVSPPKRQQRSDVDQLSDEEIVELEKGATRLHPDCAVAKLTPKTIGKLSQDLVDDAADASEANALDVVFAQTAIPVPRVRRVVKLRWKFMIITDYIKGPTLADIWSTLSMWRKLFIAFTLRRYVRQLRRVKAFSTTPPGPLSAHGPFICESPVFGQARSQRGPFSSYSELSAFFNQRLCMTLDSQTVPKDDPSRKDLFNDSGSLVMTNQDLNLRNIIVDDGHRWIIDRAWAGCYPPWFEYVAMQQNEDERISGTSDALWRALIPFICGPYYRQERWLWDIGLALSYK